MKLIILNEKLKEGLKITEKITQKTFTLPILQNTLFETEKNFLKLSATNLETGVVCWNLAKIEKEGKICVPTIFTSKLVNNFSSKQISLEVKDFILFLENENYHTKIKGFDPNEFPIIPSIKKEESFLIDCHLFCQGLSQVFDIPSSSLTRPEISGIFLSFQSDSLKIVATDSFRLIEQKFLLKTNLSKEYSLILPQEAAREIINIFGDKKGDIKIYLSPNQIWFEYLMAEVSHPQIQFTSKLIEGEYPNYQEIIPKKFETEFIVPKEEFLNHLKTASFFSGKTNEVTLKIHPKEKEIEITSQNPNIGEYKSVLKGEIKGKENLISFNYRFLIKGISEIKTKDLVFKISNKEGPALLKPTQPLTGEDYLYIVMPIKTS